MVSVLPLYSTFANLSNNFLDQSIHKRREQHRVQASAEQERLSSQEGEGLALQREGHAG